MATKQNIPAPEVLTPAQHVRSDWKAFAGRISNKGIVDNIPFIGFLVLLCVVYISNNQKAIEVQSELNKKTEVLKELRWKYMDIKSQLMTAGMETEIIRNGSNLGLQPLTMPAYTIETTDSLHTH